VEAVGCGAGLAGGRAGGAVGEGWSGGGDVPEDVFGVAIVGVDESFGLRVAVRAVASAVEWEVCGSCADVRRGVQEACERLRGCCFHCCYASQLMREFVKNMLVTFCSARADIEALPSYDVAPEKVHRDLSKVLSASLILILKGISQLVNL